MASAPNLPRPKHDSRRLEVRLVRNPQLKALQRRACLVRTFQVGPQARLLFPGRASGGMDPEWTRNGPRMAGFAFLRCPGFRSWISREYLWAMTRVS